ncbi:MAG: cobalt ECF transporter T component CbiQ [Candidatus Omnitrophica bacterium CG1_02_44_16]|nr:MAG: cobalt ECF transporter T component CbiQ [Candidatus Omnitrophica bacterium CG1_02_44_16]PIZ84139.1 MAG: cobalt ECF transporter T component CbiQ [Candidatus Omnitrophica bacterium CG_4_10_14_0_2_um_filter_44_9]
MFKKSNFIERSLTGALSFIKGSIFAEGYASRIGFLQSLDPRIKAATFLLFLLQILFTKNILVLLYLYALCLMLAQVSRIDLLFFLKRTWVFIPLFSLFIAIPALFSIFTPGDPLVSFSLIGHKLTITHQGLSGAELFVTRVITSVSFVVLLSITTKHFELLKVLRIFKIPQVFVMTLGMCYRYIYLFAEIIEDTYLAIKSRVGTLVHYKRGQHLVAWNIAYLWHRSYQLNEEVYKAMLSRGYAGEPAVLTDFRFKPKDLVWFIFAAIMFTAMRKYG